MNKEKQRKKNSTLLSGNTYEDNGKFLQYYKMQNICPASEWDEFIAILKSKLPTSFRIMARFNTEANIMLKFVEGVFFTDLLKENIIDIPLCLPWYPKRLGWQVTISNMNIRSSNAYNRIHTFLTSEMENGNISRQEAVSMIPPILLDIKSYDKVLDMCAAPGSKTAQLIENLYSSSTSSVPEGLVIANEIFKSRCYTLAHRAKRLNSANVMITNHDATVLPIMNLDENGNTQLKFDKIVCDVPCSGDGSIRKNPDIWTIWCPEFANNLHRVQYRILKRGLELLNIGGYLVYSTCSFNPVENEAVIQRMLIETEASIVIMDISDKLPGLKTSDGLSKWVVMSKKLDVYNTYDEVPKEFTTQIKPEMFPLKDDLYNLKRCIRILPHHQNTGGLFVTVLKKIKSLPWETVYKQPEEKNEYIDEKDVVENIEKIQKQISRKDNPFVFLTSDDIVWPEIRDFYELKNFPIDNLFTRFSTGKKKNIYFASQNIKDILKNNQDQIKITNAGVKTFVHHDKKSTECNFKLVQEGLAEISVYIGVKRRLKLTQNEIIEILNTPIIPITNLEESTRDRLVNFGIGSCILNIDDNNFPLELVGWKGFSTLQAYINCESRLHYLRLLGADVSNFDENIFKDDY